MASAATKHKMFSGYNDNGAAIYLGSDGNLYGTGLNSSGILCQGNTSSLNTFTALKRPASGAISDFVIAESAKSVSANLAALFYLDADGKLFGAGQLANVGIGAPIYGADTPAGYHYPVRVPVV